MALSAAAILASLLGVLGWSEPKLLQPLHNGYEHALENLGPPVPVFAAAPAETSKPAPPFPKTKSFAITVKPNQCVSDLALQYLGDFNEDRIREIQELNPSLTDPDHIEVGQTIWLPAR
jgi:nucleoid-associated protein YgaU